MYLGPVQWRALIHSKANPALCLVTRACLLNIVKYTFVADKTYGT